MAEESKYLLTVAELAELTGETETQILKAFENDRLLRLSRTRTAIPPPLVREYLRRKGFPGGFKVIAHINLRGGVGKTTTTVTAATRAAAYGFRTCILDLDPQGSSSLALDRVPEEEDPIFYDLWKAPHDMLMGSLKVVQENLLLLPSSLENGLLDSSLIHPGSQKKAVRETCEELRANEFELVFVDCPPSLGTAVISTICASDIIVIPVGSDAFSFKGLSLTLREIASVCDTFQQPLPDIKILYTRFDRRERMAIEGLDRLSSGYSGRFIPIVIRISTEFSKALEKRETVFASHKRSNARDDYDRYLRYLLELDKFFQGGCCHGGS